MLLTRANRPRTFTMGYTLSRRGLFHGAAGACLVGLPACAATATTARHDRRGPRVAIAGVRAQGRRHLRHLLRRSDVEVVAVCDPDIRVAGAAGALAARHGRRVRMFADIRKLLDTEFDALVVATPDHWHCVMTTWACEAGKHVFVESPPTHGLLEGRMMLAAARRHRCLVQPALPLRDDPGFRRGVALLHEGDLGRLQSVRAVCFRPRPSIGRMVGPPRAPSGVDYDLWTGPAPFQPLRRRELHGDWRFDWRTGNGEIGEWGTHLLDLSRWIVRAESLPMRVWTLGGRLGVPDDGETPNTLLARLDFGSGVFGTVPVTFELRTLPTAPRRAGGLADAGDLRLGVVVSCTRGTIIFDAQLGRTTVLDRAGKVIHEFGGRADPLAEFVTRLHQQRWAGDEIDTALGSADLMHLVNIAHRAAGPATRIDAMRGLLDCGEMLDRFDSMDRHLSRHGIDFDQAGLRLSGWCSLQPFTGEFLHQPGANELRARTYRERYSPGLLSQTV